MSTCYDPKDARFHVPTVNSVYDGYELRLPSETPEGLEHHIVYRPKDNLFGYCAWPASCVDENGVIYAVSAAFRTAHACPFGKLAMYISRDGGITWSHPIVMVDTFCEEMDAGICYMGKGRIILSYASKPADLNYFEYYNRLNDTIWGQTGSPLGDLRAAMVDCYDLIPPEMLVGGSYVIVSEDYGFTWSEPVKIPIMNVLGATRLSDSEAVIIGCDYYYDGSLTVERLKNKTDMDARITADTWDEWAEKLYKSRVGKDRKDRPITVIGTKDGGYTWEYRGDTLMPDRRFCRNVGETYAVKLPDGSLLAGGRAENEIGFENDFTVFTSRSDDDGRTWGPWNLTHIPGSPPHFLVHSSGALILTVSRRVGKVKGQFALISQDNGRTWSREYAINPNGIDYDLGQPSTVELPDGSLATIYYQIYVDENGMEDYRPCIMCTKWKL
ncbi:MAG: exo-alpha-sialidase [Clostridia bacterium]|nr:exo-alpha-sialidase [Clostridia bacterium]